MPQRLGHPGKCSKVQQAPLHLENSKKYYWLKR
jgi:hypothetical protein